MSKETYHFFRATLTKIHAIKMNNIWTQIGHKRLSRVKKERNAVKSRKVIFRKLQKLLTERALSELHGGSLFRTFNSYSFNFNGGLRKCRTGFCLLQTPRPRGKQFLWFLKIDLLQFHHIYLLSDWSKLFFFLMCLLRINLPNLCPNMIHVDALDFSEWHSKEVISSFDAQCIFMSTTDKCFVFALTGVLNQGGVKCSCCV